MLNWEDIVNATKESHNADIAFAQESRRNGFLQGRPWYVSVCSNPNREQHCKLVYVGNFETESDATLALGMQLGNTKQCTTRKQLKKHIFNLNKYDDAKAYDHIMFITIRKMSNAEYVECVYDGKYDINMDRAWSRPEYIMAYYNETNYDPYATDTDSDAE
jgi:hypothetical protein